MRLTGLTAALLIAAAPAAGFVAVPAAPVRGTAAPAAAQAPLPRTALTLIAGREKRRYAVELARTPAQQAAGMMFRRKMARDEGMLFPFARAEPGVSFWMENTILPLDIIFIGSDARVINIAADCKPLSRNFVYAAGPTLAVLELNGGEAARIGLRPGDKVDYTLP